MKDYYSKGMALKSYFFSFIKISPLLVFLLVFNSCQEKKPETKKSLNKKSKYPRMLGNIAYDSLIDNPEFKLCRGERSVVQYFALGEKTYVGEMWAIEKAVRAQYDIPETKGQSGLIRVRFIVNCKGKTGRFRLIAMDNEYNEFEFNSEISNRVLTITKSLKDWKVFKNKQQQALDYYQYLIFKIKDGQLIEILP